MDKLKYKILRNCRLGAIRHQFSNTIIYFDVDDKGCEAILLPCLIRTKESRFILKEFGNCYHFKDTDEKKWYGKMMDFVIDEEAGIILALVSPKTREVCLMEFPIVYRKNGYICTLEYMSSEDYLKSKYDISSATFINQVISSYDDNKSDDNTINCEKVKKIGKV